MDPLIWRRWGIPGRLRLDVVPMVSNRALAKEVEDLVRGMEPVTEVKANPISGSLLVTYDARGGSVDLPATIQAEIEGWLTDVRSSGRSVSEARRRALSRVLEVSRQRPGEGIGPALLTVGGYILTTLQSLTFAAIADVARRGSAGGLVKVGLTTTRSQLKALTAAAFLLTGAEL